MSIQQNTEKDGCFFFNPLSLFLVLHFYRAYCLVSTVKARKHLKL